MSKAEKKKKHEEEEVVKDKIRDQRFKGEEKREGRRRKETER